MSKRKLCKGTLVLAEKGTKHLPVGNYTVAIQETWIQDGSLKFSGTVVGECPTVTIGIAVGIGGKGTTTVPCKMEEGEIDEKES